MIQGTDDYDLVLEIIKLCDDSTGNNAIVGDNEGPTAVMYYQLPPGIESFMIQV